MLAMGAPQIARSDLCLELLKTDLQIQVVVSEQEFRQANKNRIQYFAAVSSYPSHLS
jgi:hypothetical protein